MPLDGLVDVYCVAKLRCRQASEQLVYFHTMLDVCAALLLLTRGRGAALHSVWHDPSPRELSVGGRRDYNVEH